MNCQVLLTNVTSAVGHAWLYLALILGNILWGLSDLGGAVKQGRQADQPPSTTKVHGIEAYSRYAVLPGAMLFPRN